MKKLIIEGNKAFFLLQQEGANNDELLKVRVRDVFSKYKDKSKHDLIFEKKLGRVSVSTKIANEFKKFKLKQINLERENIIKANKGFSKNVDSFLNSPMHLHYLDEMKHFYKANDREGHRVPFEKNEELKEKMVLSKIDRSPSLTYTPHGSIKEKIIEILIEDYFTSKGLTGNCVWEINANIVNDKMSFKEEGINEHL